MKTFRFIRDQQKISVVRICCSLIKLSLPVFIAQIVSVFIQYADMAMVGSLDVSFSAAIGLVSSSTWILIGICYSVSVGFSIQIAHAIGSGDKIKSRKIFQLSIFVSLIISLVLSAISIFLSPYLPYLLNADKKLCMNASNYFFIFSCSIPAIQLRSLSSYALHSTGNMIIPSFLKFTLCILDIIFNGFLIFPSRHFTFMGLSLFVPGANMGVMGAALGTAISEIIIAILMFSAALNSTYLRFKLISRPYVKKTVITTALNISSSTLVELIAINASFVITTYIVTPLGTIALAVHAFCTLIRSFCYMVGNSISIATMMMVGQTLGANKLDLVYKNAFIGIFLGIFITSLMSAILYCIGSSLFAIFTSDESIQELGMHILKVEIWSEPFLSIASIGMGALKGTKINFIPTVCSVISIWGLQIIPSLFIVDRYGLTGIWSLISLEFFLRGIIFFILIYKKEFWIGKVRRRIF